VCLARSIPNAANSSRRTPGRARLLLAHTDILECLLLRPCRGISGRIGVQFHPELKSRPFAPHPLFASFVEAAVEQSGLV